jgi:ABC-2 type transport system permease protein
LAPLAHAMLHAARTSWAASFASPIVILGRCCFYMLLMTIITALWGKVAQEQVAGGLAHLLPAGGLGFYVGVTEIAVLGTPAAHLRLEDDIRSGLLESRLLRPKSHLLLRFAEAMGSAFARMATLTLCGALLLAYSDFPMPPAGWWPGLALLMLLAAVIGVQVSLAIGLSVFWLGRAIPLHIVVQKIAFLLGGLMAPVTLYPDWLAAIGKASPFAAQMYWPATMATAPSPAIFAQAIGWQMFWIILLALLVGWVWSRGVARVLREGV